MKSGKVILVCSTCGSRNYTTSQSEKAAMKRLEVKKYCKHCNAHVTHKETK